MPSVNGRLLHEAIDHAVDLQHYSNGVVRRIIATLNRADAHLFRELVAALEKMDPASFKVERLETLLFSVRALNRAAYEAIGKELTQDLRDLVHYEAEFQAKSFDEAIPDPILARVSIAPVVPEQVYAAAMARPFQGVLLRGVLDDLEANRAKRIRETIANGYVSNRTTDQIVRDLRGTRALQYEDGIFARSRREVESVVRTAISHTAAFTRDRFEEANGELIKATQWVSTLDNRTTQMCRIRDGLNYTRDTHKPIGHKVPWLQGPGRLHWCCRSTSASVVKSWRELGLPIEDFMPSTRASMDGQVPAQTTYAQWFAKQSAARQDEILGPTRGELYRKGGLELTDFSNDQGKMLTLAQLRERNAASFSRARVPHPDAIPGAAAAVIPPAKVTGYALNPDHPTGKSKARVFASALGITGENADELVRQVREQLPLHPAEAGRVDQFGSRYNVEVPVSGPKGSRIVRTGWIVRPGANGPELVTIFVK